MAITGIWRTRKIPLSAQPIVIVSVDAMIAVLWQRLTKKIHANQDTNGLVIQTRKTMLKNKNWVWLSGCFRSISSHWIGPKYSVWSHYSHWTITTTDDKITILAQLFKLVIYFLPLDNWTNVIKIWLSWCQHRDTTYDRAKSTSNPECGCARQDKSGLCLRLESRPRLCFIRTQEATDWGRGGAIC